MLVPVAIFATQIPVRAMNRRAGNKIEDFKIMVKSWKNKTKSQVLPAKNV